MVSHGMDLVTVLIFLISVFVPSMYLLTGTFIDHVIFYYLNQLLFGHCENVGNGKSLNNPKKTLYCSNLKVLFLSLLQQFDLIKGVRIFDFKNLTFMKNPKIKKR